LSVYASQTQQNQHAVISESANLDSPWLKPRPTCLFFGFLIFYTIGGSKA
jgi:hypothetical protein